MYKVTKKEIDLGDGRIIEIETGKLAKQANGSVVVKMGNTMLLATVVSASEAREGLDFMPLSCEYREKYAAVGRFPGGFIKREARPSNSEILTARLIDRALRPLFPDDFHAETFVNVDLISADKLDMPDALAGLAASAALSVSDIPFNGPISEVRVSRIDGQFKINPTFEENEKADIDIIVAATLENIMMVEGEMNEVSEAEMIEAIKFAHEAIKKQCQAQIDLRKELNIVTREYCHETKDEGLKAKIEKETFQKYYDIAKQGLADKHKRKELFGAVKDEFLAQYSEEELAELDKVLLQKYFHDTHKDAVRRVILDEGMRLDGRDTEEIRPIWGEVDYLPGAHGSSIFTRGETQSLTTVTLGTKLNQQNIDGAVTQGTEKFILHYNFLPFSTGDARPYRGVGRREIGHGNLAHRALMKMVPGEEENNPYTVRVVSDILESNGSSSMATVCAGTLALMDAGVKIKKPVSGIAMGLITDGSDKFAVLSDILGDEDHLGDMDFKVCGTRDGITATQMDIKVDGLSYEVLAKALDQAKKGRLFILDVMKGIMPEPREDYKPHAPRMERMIIKKELIGAVIGPGGKVIQDIQKTTGAVIVIEEVGDTGVIDIASDNKESIEAAKQRIQEITKTPEIGEVYKGKVVSVVAFGAFVEIFKGTEGLLHISEIEWRKIGNVEEVLKVGDMVDVKLIDVDSRSGKLKLSRKVLLERPPRKEQ